MHLFDKSCYYLKSFSSSIDVQVVFPLLHFAVGCTFWVTFCPWRTVTESNLKWNHVCHFYPRSFDEKAVPNHLPLARLCIVGLNLTMLEHLSLISYRVRLSYHLSSEAICQDTDFTIISSHENSQQMQVLNQIQCKAKRKGWQTIIQRIRQSHTGYYSVPNACQVQKTSSMGQAFA